MIKALFRSASVAAMAVTIGCAGSPPPGKPSPSPLGAGLPVPDSPDDLLRIREPETVPAEPSAELTLRDALILALRQNPDLAVFSWEIRAREAERLQTGLIPNPGLAIEVENFAGTGESAAFRGAETTISLSQLLELGGKRGGRQRLAALDRDLAWWDYEIVRVDVLTEVTKSFVAVLAAQARVDLADELVQISEDALAAVSRRVQAGGVSPVEETRARVEAATSRLDLRIARSELAAERRRLASLWGSAAPGFAGAVGDLDARTGYPDLGALLERVDRNPTIVRWAAELELRQADVALQKALAVPDLDVTAGFRRLGGSSNNALVAGVSLPLPLFDRNQGSRRAADARLDRARAEEHAVTVRVKSALALVYEALAASGDEIASLEEEILPEAQSALATARDAYAKGLFRLTDVLDTQRTLYELRGRRLVAPADYHRAVAEIERLLGEPLFPLDEE